MTINLSKGGSINLTKAAPKITTFNFALGWDPSPNPGEEFDPDASAFMLNKDGKFADPRHFVFYNNTTSPEPNLPALVHSGDDRTGGKPGDDETITVHTDRIPDGVVEISFIVTIHDAIARKQHFGRINNAFIRVFDEDGKEYARYDLQAEFAGMTSVQFGSLVKKPDGSWAFEAVGQGSAVEVDGSPLKAYILQYEAGQFI